MIYVLCFLTLLALEVFYIKLAERFNIIDKPKERSSHTKATIRGGGIIFLCVGLLYFFLFGFNYPYAFLGLLSVGTLGFLDDIYDLKPKIRFPLQLVSLLLIFLELNLFSSFLFLGVPLLLLAVGMLNIYNFMDGINSMTGVYSISVLLSLWWIDQYNVDFIDERLIILILLSIVVYGYFNFRKKAKVFAGDVGSLSIGFFILFMVIKLSFETQNIAYLLLLIIYMGDGGLTILERVIRKEKVFEAHRRHLYQLLVDKQKLSHLQVACLFAFLQLLFSFSLIYLIELKVYSIILFFGAGAVANIFYFTVKSYYWHKE